MSFKEAVKNIPDCLKEICGRRISICLFSFLAAIVAWVVVGFYVSIPFWGLFLFFAISGGGMFYKILTGNYMIVEGICNNIELSSVRGKVKNIYISSKTGDKVLKFLPKENSKALNIGDKVKAYIPIESMVYEKDGITNVSEYYCIEIIEKKLKSTGLSRSESTRNTNTEEQSL